MAKMSILSSSSWRSLCPSPAMTRRAWCPTRSSWSGGRSRGQTSPGTLRSSSSAQMAPPSRDTPGKCCSNTEIYLLLSIVDQELSDCWHCCGHRKVCVKKALALPGASEETNNKEDETNDTEFGNNYKQTLLTFFNKLIFVLLFSSFHVPNKCTKWVQKVNIRFPRQ